MRVLLFLWLSYVNFGMGLVGEIERGLGIVVWHCFTVESLVF